MHTQLPPALCQAWRNPNALQLGLSERSAVTLDGLVAEDRPILKALADGVHPRSRVAKDPRFRVLADILAAQGLLIRRQRSRPIAASRRQLAPDEAAWSLCSEGADFWPVLSQRSQRSVVIHGHGRVALSIAALLDAAGIGTVMLTEPREIDADDLCPAGARPPDLGRPHHRFATRAPTSVGRPPRIPPAPDLIVLVEPDAADALAAAEWMAEGIDHLSVVAREGGVRVGPMVIPGQGSCLRCLDLHRTDADPSWPTVLLQLLRRRHTERGALGGIAVLAQELSLAQQAASWAALQVLVRLDHVHPPAALGRTAEFDLPDGIPVTREWPPHPECGCLGLTDP